MRYFLERELRYCAYGDRVILACHGSVFDLSDIVKSALNLINGIGPLYDNSGSDVSHWFDIVSGSLKPKDEFMSSSFLSLSRGDLPWWSDQDLVIGLFASNYTPNAHRVRSIKLRHSLTTEVLHIEIPSGETIKEIMKRCGSCFDNPDNPYSWRWKGLDLDYNKSLEGNGLHDFTAQAEILGIDLDISTPVIAIEYNEPELSFA